MCEGGGTATIKRSEANLQNKDMQTESEKDKSDKGKSETINMFYKGPLGPTDDVQRHWGARGTIKHDLTWPNMTINTFKHLTQFIMT